MAMVQVATRVPEEIRDKVAKVANEIGLDVPTILRMSMYRLANEHEMPPRKPTANKFIRHNNFHPTFKNKKVWETKVGTNGVVRLPDDFPSILADNWG